MAASTVRSSDRAVVSVVMIPPAVSGGNCSRLRTSAASMLAISLTSWSCRGLGTWARMSTRSSGSMYSSTRAASGTSMSVITLAANVASISERMLAAVSGSRYSATSADNSRGRCSSTAAPSGAAISSMCSATPASVMSVGAMAIGTEVVSSSGSASLISIRAGAAPFPFPGSSGKRRESDLSSGRGSMTSIQRRIPEQRHGFLHQVVVRQKVGVQPAQVEPGLGQESRGRKVICQRPRHDRAQLALTRLADELVEQHAAQSLPPKLVIDSQVQQSQRLGLDLGLCHGQGHELVLVLGHQHGALLHTAQDLLEHEPPVVVDGVGINQLLARLPLFDDPFLKEPLARALDVQVLRRLDRA